MPERDIGRSCVFDVDDVAAVLREHPRLQVPERVEGHQLRFRAVVEADAEFILSLRTDPEKNRFISPVSADVDAQRQWIRRHRRSDLYFIVTAPDGQAIGTVRLYDQRGTSITWGSWILSRERPSGAALESVLLILAVADDLGFTEVRCDIRKANEKVWRIHERLGFVRAGQDELAFYYALDRGGIRATLTRFQERLPNGVTLDW